MHTVTAKQRPELLCSAEDGNLPSDPLAVGVLTERCAVAVKVHLSIGRNPSLRPKCKELLADLLVLVVLINPLVIRLK